MNRWLLILATTFIYGGEVNVINMCKEAKLLDLSYKKRKDFDGKEVWGIEFGVKNSSDKKLDLDIILYPKDKEGHRIAEHSLSPSVLKPYYEYPMPSGIYYPVGENMNSFGGDADMVVTCKTTQYKNETKSGSIRFIFSPERVERIKKATGAEDELEVRAQIAAMTELLIREKGVQEIAKKLSKCEEKNNER